MGKFYHLQKENLSDNDQESAVLVNENPSNSHQLDAVDSMQLSQVGLISIGGSQAVQSSAIEKRQHTAFRPLLSFIRKTIQALVKGKIDRRVRNFLSPMSKSYNQGSFCILIHIAKKYGVLNSLQLKFSHEYTLKINPFRWRPSRQKEAIQWADRFCNAFMQQSIDGQLRAIWEKKNKAIHKKFRSCKANVQKVVNQLNRLPKRIWRQ